MSATDELRRLLDERGVEWEMPIGILSHIKTVWRIGLWEYKAIETSGGEFSVYAERRDWITPEQVIDTTLGNDEIDELKDDYYTLIRENKQLQAKVIAQSDHINKLRGEYKVLDKQMERRCAEYRATIRKLKAELDAATLGNDGVERTKNGVDKRFTTRNTKRTVYGNPRPVCEVCGYGIGDKRWHYCPKCGARIVEVDE